MGKTLAAIPAYDEELAIGSVILRCTNYVDDVLVVDDGSKDRTAEVASVAKAFVVRHETNRGKGAAIQSALKFAQTNGYDAMVILDGDGQHDPSYIPDLLAPIAHGEAEMTIGVRRIATTKMPLYRRFGQRVLDYLTAFGSKGTVTDSQSGFRALSRAAIESLSLDERGFSIESEMIVDAQQKSLRIAEVPIRVRYDLEGSTKGPVSHGFGVVDGLLRIVAVRHPLLFFGVFGSALLAVGILVGLIALNTYKHAPELAIGYSFLVVIFLVIGGLSIFAGVMLNVLPRAVVRTLRGRSG